MINISEIEEIEQKINRRYEKRNESEEAYEKFMNTLSKYTGPATGLIWDENTKKVTIAATHAPDTEGNILNISEATGPATGKAVVDGVITQVV